MDTPIYLGELTFNSRGQLIAAAEACADELDAQIESLLSMQEVPA